MASTSQEVGDEESPVARLTQENDQLKEEVRTWKIRCLQAEAEVRALKNRTRHADPAPLAPSSARSPQADEQAFVFPTQDFSTQESPPGGSSLRSSPRNSQGDEMAREGRLQMRRNMRRSWPDRGSGSPLRDASEALENAPMLAEMERLRVEVERLKAATSRSSGAIETNGTAANQDQIIGGAHEATPQASGVRFEPLAGEAFDALQGMTQRSCLRTGNETFWSVGTYRPGIEGAQLEIKPQSEVQELQQQISRKDFAIVQLQADMVKDKKELDSQRKAAENQNMINLEELREMTQRAESLSEQVKKSKRKASELVVAQAEVAKLSTDLQECEACLAGQTDAAESLTRFREEALQELSGSREQASEFSREVAEARNEMHAEVADRHEELQQLRRRSMTMDSEQSELERCLEETSLEAAEAREMHAATKVRLEKAEWAEAEDGVVENENQDGKDDDAAPKLTLRRPSMTTGRQQRIMRCLNEVKQFHLEMVQEMRTATASSSTAVVPVANAATPSAEVAGGADAASPAENAEVPVLPTGNAAAADARRPQNLEAQMQTHLELALQMVRRVAADEEPVGDLSDFTADDLRQELLDSKIKREVMKDELTTQHCEELDDLIRRHDVERRSWYQEMTDLRTETARKEANGAVTRPMTEIRQHLKEQVETVKHELVAQLSDLHERQRQDRGDEEKEQQVLRSSLERCQTELSSSQGEWKILAALFEKERRENVQLRRDVQSETAIVEAERQAERRREALTAFEENGKRAKMDSVNGSPPLRSLETTEVWDTMHVERERLATDDEVVKVASRNSRTPGCSLQLQAASPAGCSLHSVTEGAEPGAYPNSVTSVSMLSVKSSQRLPEGRESPNLGGASCSVQTPPHIVGLRASAPPPPSSSCGAASRPSSISTNRPSPAPTPPLFRSAGDSARSGVSQPQPTPSPGSPTAATAGPTMHSAAAGLAAVASRLPRAAALVSYTQSRGNVATF